MTMRYRSEALPYKAAFTRRAAAVRLTASAAVRDDARRWRDSHSI